jgi:hypothetical protein
LQKLLLNPTENLYDVDIKCFFRGFFEVEKSVEITIKFG